MTRKSWFHHSASALIVLGVLWASGCASTAPTEKEQRAAQARVEAARTFKSNLNSGTERVSIHELDQLTYGYADRYFMVISSAADAIKRGNTDPLQRRIAHQTMLNGVLAMNDIVSGDDPYARTLDLVVSVTLESILLIDENGAERMFGDRAPILISAIRTMRVEAWELAAKVLNQEQLELLDYIILEWRRTHRDIEQVAYVKFDNFASARAAGLLAGLKAGDGFLAPLSEASLVLKDWARLTERAFWYSKRAPNIAAIQAEGAMNEILSTPEVNSLLQTADRLTKTAEGAPQTIDAQRKALFSELDARQTLLTNTLSDVRYIVADVRALGGTVSLLTTNVQTTLVTLGDTLKVADAVGRSFGLDHPSTNPPARPFDIQDYTIALARLNEVVTNVHQLSLNVDQVTRSEGWNKILKDMTDATDRRVDRAFSRLCILLLIAFVLAIIYRVISLRLQQRIARSTEEKP
jgi:hypothetical protein